MPTLLRRPITIEGSLKQGLGQHAEALTDYDKAIQLKPDYIKAYNNRGVRNGNSANMPLLSLIMTSPSDVTLLKPTVRGRRRNSVNMMPLSRHSNTSQSECAAPYYNRGAVKVVQGEHAAAIADFDEAIQRNPDLIDAYYNRGLLRVIFINMPRQYKTLTS